MKHAHLDMTWHKTVFRVKISGPQPTSFTTQRPPTEPYSRRQPRHSAVTPSTSSRDPEDKLMQLEQNGTSNISNSHTTTTPNFHDPRTTSKSTSNSTDTDTDTSNGEPNGYDGEKPFHGEEQGETEPTDFEHAETAVTSAEAVAVAMNGLNGLRSTPACSAPLLTTTASHSINELGLEIREVKGRGRGVFARELIPAGRVLEESPVLLLTKEQWEEGKMNDTILGEYGFCWANGGMAIGLGLGE